jgi:dTDP-4-amino-4,6-dideoxygalactose transaminase
MPAAEGALVPKFVCDPGDPRDPRDHPKCGSMPARLHHPMITDRIPLAEPDLSGREKNYLLACVETNWVSSAGPYVGAFEERVAAAAGRRHAVALVNGTAALHLALVAAGVRPGARVIVPDFTFAATANAVYHAGAMPCFLDVRAETWSLDPDLVEAALADASAPVAAVVAVHTLGTPADMDPLAQLCVRAGVPLIEDAAGALGARYKGRPVGMLGDAAMFSFNGNKTVTAGGGGVMVTDREDWAQRARALSIQARSGSRYRYDDIGFNYRLTNVNAAIGLAQMERLDAMIARKRQIAAAYDAALAGRGDLRPMPRPAWADSACWLYSVLCATTADAEALVAALNAERIEARLFWEALSPQAPYAEAPRRLTGVARGLSGRIVSLPCSTGLGETQQQRVIAALDRWRGADLREPA